MLVNYSIWLERLSYIGTISEKICFQNGFTGVMLRGSGISWDLRKNYDLLYFYNKIKFNIPVAQNGDCYDRFLIRFEEMYQSLSIMEQCIYLLENENTSDKIKQLNMKLSIPDRHLMKQGMEYMINHFKYCTEGFQITENETYVGIEAPKGEFGVSLLSDNSSRPYRCKIRAPGFFHLQGLDTFIRNALLADLVTTIGTLDLVFGEIDR